ncbi:DUF4124 domain-containing protein [Undibacterium fentianense]|uniref:DUF4124 domain-containing protein n=1 Tax=Undibacterium fentianense TaxID=2828728 RepID=A0A941IGI9_9BURK|nr:DUF4124 domain-containing protein [Undibacterium fentianense]MBR7801422.1 DUF4124 domain-containing protein [Undibacterium fentianense]
MKSTRLIAFSLFSGLVVLSANVTAQVKKCTDKNGKVTYTQAVCPQATAKDKTIMAYTPVSNAAPAAGRDLYAENQAFNQRQAQRNRIEAVQNSNREAIAAFEKAVNRPLAPGEVRRTTLTIK